MPCSETCPLSNRDHGVLSTLETYATNKKSGYERESAAVGYHSLCTIIGAPVLPLLLPALPILLELLSDKGDVVRSAASLAIRSLVLLTPIQGLHSVMGILSSELENNGKWKAKVGCLKEIGRLTDLRGAGGKEEVADMLGTLLPIIEKAMHDTKAEVATAAKKAATTLCGTLPNPDLRPHIPLLISAMAAPNTVPDTIKSLSNTTFVAEVTAPSLAVLVPLLTRGLNDRGMDTQRRTVVVVENVCKLVRDPVVAARYLSPLVDGVEKIAAGASFPEVREFASSTLKTLVAAGASKDVQPPPPRDHAAEATVAINTITPQLPSYLFTRSPNSAVLPPMPFHPLFSQALQFVGRLVADLIYKKSFAQQGSWHACVGVYVRPWLVGENADEDATRISEAIRTTFWKAEKVVNYAVAARIVDFTENESCRRLGLLQLIREKISYATYNFPSHTAPYYSFHTLHSASCGVEDTESAQAMGAGRVLSSARYAMGR